MWNGLNAWVLDGQLLLSVHSSIHWSNCSSISVSLLAHMHSENFPLYLLILSIHLLNYTTPYIHPFIHPLMRYLLPIHKLIYSSIHIYPSSFLFFHLPTHKDIHLSIMYPNSICPSIHSFIHPLIHQSNHSSDHLPSHSTIYRYIYWTINPSIYLFIRPFFYSSTCLLPTHLSIYPFIQLSTIHSHLSIHHLSIHRFVHPSVHPFICHPSHSSIHLPTIPPMHPSSERSSSTCGWYVPLMMAAESSGPWGRVSHPSAWWGDIEMSWWCLSGLETSEVLLATLLISHWSRNEEILGRGDWQLTHGVKTSVPTMAVSCHFCVLIKYTTLVLFSVDYRSTPIRRERWHYCIVLND